jgi:hypothetical protein
VEIGDNLNSGRMKAMLRSANAYTYAFALALALAFGSACAGTRVTVHGCYCTDKDDGKMTPKVEDRERRSIEVREQRAESRVEWKVQENKRGSLQNWTNFSSWPIRGQPSSMVNAHPPSMHKSVPPTT